jgi:hypothetical protein
MSLLEIAHAVEASPLGTALRESRYSFPSLIIVHLSGLLVTVGTVSLWDLRLLGVSLRATPVSRVGRALLPWTWAGFSVMVLSGAALVSMEAARLYPNTAFRMKLGLLILAGINMLTFHLTIFRSVASWDQNNKVPLRARVAGAISLAVWLGLVTAGRAIGYTIDYGS